MNTLKPGTVLKGENIYRIERVLGVGGFGITYLASFAVKVGNLSITGNVAIKEHFPKDYCERGTDGNTMVCPGTVTTKEMVGNSLKDFLAEARRLREYSAGHPNIVKVNEILEANGTAYYVMEFLKGQSLSEYISQHGSLSEQEIEQLVYPVIDAVSYLHSQQVTHLDIKPGNIMLAQNEDGSLRPVLIDFGLSKHYNEDGSATSTVNTMACSEGYAPMEQYSGISTFSPAADVYALGATLYDAATGKRPVKSAAWPSGEPSATIDTLPVSERLRGVMKKALSPMASDRYPDAGAMLEALGVKSAASTGTATVRLSKESKKGTETVLIDSKQIPAEPKKNILRPVLIAACAVLFVLVVWGLYAFIGKSSPEPESTVLIAEAEEESENLPAEEVPQTSAQKTESDEAVRMTAEREELERQRQEAERLNTERAETERRQQEAAEQERIRQENEARERQRQEAQIHTPHNLDLAVRRGNQTLYFNQSNWQNLYQSGDQKLGVVIDKNGQRFILALEDLAGGEELNWEEAMRRFRSKLPSKEQGKAISEQYTNVFNAMQAYGHDLYIMYWTKTISEETSLHAYYFGVGDVFSSHRTKGTLVKARAIFPMP